MWVVLVAENNKVSYWIVARMPGRINSS